MRSYSYVKMIVDGKSTSDLEIFKENNMFSVYEYGENVLTGSYLNVIAFIDEWKKKHNELVKYLEATGSTVSYEQTIK